MAEDVVRKMGYLCLGSRFKRIGERLQGDVQRFIDDAGLTIQTSQYPLLVAIDQNGAMTIGELGAALGVSQPGVTRNVNRLVALGLVAINRNLPDQRQRGVALTAAGRQVIERSKREIWPHIEGAVTGLCAGLSGPLLGQLGAIEDGLDAEPLDRRAAALSVRRAPVRKARRAGGGR